MTSKQGIAMCGFDGLSGLVGDDLAGVIRVGVKGRNGKFCEIGVIIVSGENSWSVSEGLWAIQDELERVLGKNFTHFVADAAPGNVAALGKIHGKHGEPQKLPADKKERTYMVDQPVCEVCSSDDGDISPASSIPDVLLGGKYTHARCSMHAKVKDFPAKRKRHPLKKKQHYD
jgi:hypothetical protein